MESVSAAISVFNIAAEKAVEGGKVFGPGSFKTKLLDSVYGLTKDDVDGSIRMELRKV